MIIEILANKLEDSGMGFSSRQEGVDEPDVIVQNNTKKIIVPEKFRTDVEALRKYAEFGLESGLCITVSLSELLTICPRERKRTDAFSGLVNFLKEEMNVTLIIKSQKTMHYD